MNFLFKNLLRKISFHYVVYTILFLAVVFSYINLVSGAVPNPGHPWEQVGDGVFVFSNGESNTANKKTYNFPNVNSYVWTTGSTIASGSVLVSNTVNTLGALTSTVGTKVLTNTSGVIDWVTPASGMVWPAGSTAGIPYYNGSQGWGTTHTTTGSGTVIVRQTSPEIISPTITTSIVPTVNDGAPLGDITHNFSDLYLASGGVINYANGNVVLTHTSGILTLGTGTLKITTPTNTAGSVVTIDGTQTLTNKTLTSPNINEALALTTTSTKLNYLTGATGTTGTNTGKIVFDTTPTFVTNITTPFILGGTGTTSPLTFQTTSGVGTTGADMHFKVGNNGATEAMTILNNGNVGIGTMTPGSFKLNVNGDAQVNNLTFANPGFGVDTRLTFTKLTDAAWISVNEVGSDSTEFSFNMSDNPDQPSDKFYWKMSDWQGTGGAWVPLQFNGLNTQIAGANINAYGNYNVYGPWYSSDGVPNTIYASKTGTLNLTPNPSAYNAASTVYWFKIDGTGSPNTFSWGVGPTGGAASGTGIAITGSAQTISNGLTVTFSATTGGVMNDLWQFRVSSGGNMRVSNGLASAPSYSFTGDTNSGMYLNAADKISLVTGGSDRLIIDSNGNVGIGTTDPQAKLHVTDGTLLLTGTTGSIPVIAAGTRLMWVPEKGSFMAGTVTNNSYNSIGTNSMAIGRDVTAIGDYSIATGYMSRSVGINSVAMGNNAFASGSGSLALGENTSASGLSAVALGNMTRAGGDFSTAMGFGTIADSYDSFAIGLYNVGGGTTDSWVSTDPLFEIGMGVDEFNKANALTVLKNGNVGIGTTSPTARLHLAAGTATAGTAPLKFTSGTLLTAPETGSIEFLTDAYYGTITTGAARKQFAFTDSNIDNGTSGTIKTGTIELGHATDTTLSRSAAGVLAVEGTAIPKGTGTTNEIAYWSGTNTLSSLAVATYPTLAELSYVRGVTSSIQSQFTGKQASHANLTSLSGLTFASPSFVKMTGANTFTLDINTYLTSSTGVTTFSGGSTGLTPSSATSGAITLGGTLAVASGGTGTGTAFTPGSIVFAGASGVYSQDNAAFFINPTLNRLGIGTNTPTAKLDVTQPTSGVGTVSNAAGGTTVTGVGTQFTDTFKIGDTITIGGQTVAISAIASDTSMTTAAITNLNSGVAYTLTGGSRFVVKGNGNVGIGQTTPTARLHLAAGTAAAGTAPLKLTSGTNLTATEAGVIEYNGTHLYFTAANAGTRYQLDQQLTVGSSSITSGTTGRVLYDNAGVLGEMTTTGTAGSVVLSTTPSFVTSVVGDATFAVFNTVSTNINAFGAATTLNLGAGTTSLTAFGTISAATLSIGSGATTSGLTKTLNLGANGATGSTSNINIGTGLVGTGTITLGTATNGTTNIAGPFQLAGTGVTTTAARLNYLTSVTGTTGTATGKIVFDTAPTFVTSITTPLVYGSATTANNLTLRSNSTDLTTGSVIFSDSKDSTTTTTGAVQIAGGLGVAKAFNALTLNGLTITANGSNTLNIAASQGLTVSGGGTIAAGSAAYTLSSIYPLLAGRSGGQTLSGSTLTAENLTLRGNAADLTSGGVLITTSTDSSSSITGALQVSGGAGIAKKLYVGTTATIGTNSGTGGQITLNGSTSGSGVIKVNPAAGAGIVFQLPSANGSNTNILQTDGAGVTSWVAATGMTWPAGGAGIPYYNGSQGWGTTHTLTGSGTVLALATTPTFVTNITSPLVIGGSTTTSDLNFQTTSGIGATGADMHFLVGNNGATEAMTVLNDGKVGIGTNAPNSKLTIKNNSTVGYSVDGLLGSILYIDNGSAANGSIVMKTHSVGDNNSIGGLKFASSPDGLNYSWSGIQGLSDVNGAASKLAFYTAAGNTTGATSTERMRIDINGNVGIGTTTPNLAKLQIDSGNGVVGQYINGGTTIGTDLLKLRANAANQKLVLEGAGGTVQTFLEAGGSIGLFGTFTNHDFRIRTNYIDRMAFDTNGNVGIGSTAPLAKFHVQGIAVPNFDRDDYSIQIVEDTNSRLELAAADSGSDAAAFVLTDAVGAGDNRKWFFGAGTSADSNKLHIGYSTSLSDVNPAGSSMFSMTTAGLVGIGTSSPSAKLHIFESTTSGASLLLLRDEPNFASIEMKSIGSDTFLIKSGTNDSLNFSSNNTDTPSLNINASGKVGIGTTTPGAKLDVYGTAATDGIRTNIGLDLSYTTAPAVGDFSVSSVNTSIGNVNNGEHYYHVTYITALGETTTQNYGNNITADSTHKQMIVNLPISSDPRVIGRKIYRTVANGYYWDAYLLATINNNTATTYTDNIADANLGTENGYQRVNTTNNAITINGVKAMTLDNSLTLFGVGAGGDLTTGMRNTLYGARAGGLLTTGSQNTFIGDEAGLYTTTGTSNVAVGIGALYSNDAGGYNVAMGRNTLLYGTGSENVAIGFSTAVSNRGGDYNTLVGGFAFYNATGASYSNNTALGYAAGYSNAASGGLYLGFQAGYYETGASKLFIDNQQRTSESDARNKAMMYGVFNASPASQYLTINAKVGINTISPQDTFEVKTPGLGSIRFGGDDGQTLSAFNGAGQPENFNFIGGATFTDNLYVSTLMDLGTQTQGIVFSDTTLSMWTNTLERLTIANDGKVGIGTTGPGYLLDVNGTIRTGNPGLDGSLIIYSEQGATDYSVTFNPAASMTANTTYTLPPAYAGTTGMQLSSTTGGVMTWTAASSTRDSKDNITPFVNSAAALSDILKAKVYTYNYKPGMGTGDSLTTYVGIMADEAPWAMHYEGNVINPVNTLGYMVLGLQATNDKFAVIEKNIADNNSSIMTSIEGLITSGQDAKDRIKVIEDLLEAGAFDNQTKFTIPPLFNNDTAGFAVIHAGSKKVSVSYSELYIAEPIVSASLVFNKTSGLSDELADNLFMEDIKSIVTDSDESGFTILINKNAPSDLRFAWTAFAVTDPKIFESVIEGLTFENSDVESEASNSGSSDLNSSISGPSATGTPDGVADSDMETGREVNDITIEEAFIDEDPIIINEPASGTISW